MWTPIILICAYANINCIAIGGPATITEETCISSIFKQGMPYLKQKYPGKIFLDYKCVEWDTET
jgi:hypothetical protein